MVADLQLATQLERVKESACIGSRWARVSVIETLVCKWVLGTVRLIRLLSGILFLSCVNAGCKHMHMHIR